jgi:hypothetical protein
MESKEDRFPPSKMSTFRKEKREPKAEWTEKWPESR